MLSVPVILVISVMVMNGCSNFILFKLRSLKWFHFILYPFTALQIALIISLSFADRPSGLLAFLYLLWLAYDLYYTYNLWRLNRNVGTS